MKIFFKTICLFLVFSVICHCEVSFAALDVAQEMALFEEIPMVFSASRIEESIQEAPAAMSVITAEDLKQRGIVDLVDAFRFVPGMDVARFSGRDSGVTARGMNENFGRRMLVLIDGMSVYGPFISGVPWENLPLILEDIEKIEIVRGPNDTLYGFNAFNGVINITTKSPEKTRGLYGGYIFGTQGRDKFVGRVGDHIDLGEAGTVDFRTTYSFHQNNGFGDDGGTQFSDKTHQNLVSSRVLYTPNERWNVDFSFGVNANRSGKAPIPNGSAGTIEQREYYYFNTQLNFKATENQDMSLQFYYWDESLDSKNLTLGIPNGDGDRMQTDVEFQDTITTLDGRSTTVVGASYRRNTVKDFNVNRNPSSSSEIPTTHDNLYSVFVNEKFILLEDKRLIDKLSVAAGVRVEGSEFIPNPEWAPRASLMYSPVENHTLRATYARAFRLPSFVEEKGLVLTPVNTGALTRFEGSKSLEREEVNSYEVGYSGLFWNKKISFDADGYIANYSSLVNPTVVQPLVLGLAIIPQRNSLNNSAKARSFGFELESSVKLTNWAKAWGNYTFQEITDNITGALPSKLADSSPKHKFTLGTNIQLEKDTVPGMPFLEGTDFNLMWHFRDSYVFYDTNAFITNVFNVKDDHRLDLRLAKSFYEEAVEVAFIAQNLLENKHFESNFIQVPRMFFMTVTLREWPWEVFKDASDRQKSLLNSLNRASA